MVNIKIKGVYPQSHKDKRLRGRTFPITEIKGSLVPLKDGSWTLTIQKKETQDTLQRAFTKRRGGYNVRTTRQYSND